MRLFLTAMSIAALLLSPSLGNAKSILNLPAEEAAVVSSALKWDLSQSDVATRRPIIVLDETDNWLPQNRKEDLRALSPEERRQVQEQLELQRIPGEMRSANVSKYRLIGLKLPENSQIYSAAEFEKRYGHKSFREVLRQFGKEPYVLSVSRPYITPDGKAILILHRLSTWSGCGGVDILHFVSNGDQWNVEDTWLLAFW